MRQEGVSRERYNNQGRFGKEYLLAADGRGKQLPPLEAEVVRAHEKSK